MSEVGGGELFAMSGRLATGVVDVTDDPAALDGSGFWAVLATFEGAITCVRFADVRPLPGWPALCGGRAWRGPAADAWTSSLDEAGYTRGVDAVRARIAAGDVYQANLCRVLRAPHTGADVTALAVRLARGNPAPYLGVLRAAGLQVVSASPETFLHRDRDVVQSRPIKGTGATEADLTDKDQAENVMIVDLVRNDLARVVGPGTLEVPELCVVEQHPGLVHLVSTVRGRLRPEVGWADLLAATLPPGSVSGAPKSTALEIIAELEPVPRGPYCGAIGWVDADSGRGDLAVGIRTFWVDDGALAFGTGAGITWRSDPGREWDETRLKAARLVGLASVASAP